MQTRLILLFVLFLVMSLFYGTVVRQSMPNIEAKQKAQFELLNSMDERAHSRRQTGS